MSCYNAIGTMSGTSLDGLDLAYCSFELLEDKWSFLINSAETISFPEQLQRKLAQSKKLSGLDLMKLHNELGNFIGNAVAEFIQTNNIDKAKIDGIASHGHTVFHQPEIKLTTQIGNGANIAAIAMLPVICDFRTYDVALNGQGAPLVPIGDKNLFSAYDYCINLGGIANISFEENKERIAFDICPVNLVLNKLAQELGETYDKNGDLAQSGKIDLALLDQLNTLSYYKKSPPKSLGMEQIEARVFPIIQLSKISTTDKLRTFVEHIAIQIANTISTTNKKILLTGGGTFNTYLSDRIKANTANEIIIPSKQLIDFKEALIFAFLGVLRLRKESNCLKSVTGANQNNIGGCIYQGS
jgi:anhydro-N-acetylmuramic acid kinase